MKQRGSLWFCMKKCFHFFFFKQVLSIVDRLISHTYFWNITDRFIPVFNKHIICIYEIAVDIVDNLRMSSRIQHFFFGIRSTAESDNHTMNMRFLAGFAVPSKCAIRKVNVYSCLKQWFPEVRNTFPLRNRICGHKCAANRRIAHQVACLLIPAAHIIQISSILPACKKRIYIRFLLFAHQSRTHKRRIC